VATHVGRTEEINNLVKKVVDEFGKIDILVNNAATNPTMAQALDVDERAWDSIMNLNLKGLFFLSQAVARVMKEKGGGKIINVSSIAGISPDMLPIYSISKAAVIMATKVMAMQWAQYKIRANCIAPGLTKTKFSEALWNNPDILKHAMASTPMARWATRRNGRGNPVPRFGRLQLRNRPGHRHRRRQNHIAAGSWPQSPGLRQPARAGKLWKNSTGGKEASPGLLGPPNFPVPEFFHSFRGQGGILAGFWPRRKLYLLVAALPANRWLLIIDQTRTFGTKPKSAI